MTISSGSDFTFVFDLGLSPEIKLEVEAKDEIPSYKISVDAADKKPMVENLKKYYEEKKETKTDEEIEKEVTDRLTEQYRQESEWRQSTDIRKHFVEKAGIKLPEEFLKRMSRRSAPQSSRTSSGRWCAASL